MGTFNDISADFSLDARGSLKLAEDADAIRQSVKNILLTLTGSRPGTAQEYYGTGLRKFTFAPLTNYSGQRLGNEVIVALEKFEPRITIQNVEINVNGEENRFDMEIYYVINSAKGQVQEFRMVVNQI